MSKFERRIPGIRPRRAAGPLPWAFAALLAFQAGAAAAEPGADRVARGITAEGQAAVAGVTAEQGQLLALQRARASAIERAYGAAAPASTRVTDGAAAADLLKVYSRGYIVREDVERLPDGWYRESRSAPPIPEYGVRITVDVQLPARKIPPMNLAARLGANVYREGEKASLRVNASREARIAVFNITADDRVSMIYPHPTDRLTELPAGVTVTLPGADSQYEWVLQMQPGHKEDVEAFFIVALDKSRDLDFSGLFEWGLPMRVSGFFEKYAELATWCEDYLLAYRVVPRSSQQ